MTSDLSGSASSTVVPASESSIPPSGRAAGGGGYGNIYTPHAGSMIIQVQRESGLQSRTIVLSARQIRILRFIMSRSGKLIAAAVGVIAVLLIVEAARVPALTGRLSRMEHTAQRLDTLERSLSELQKRYDQVRTMMGGDAPIDGERAASAAPGFTPAPAIRTRAPANGPVRATTRAATDVPSEPGSADAAGAASGAAGTEASADSGGTVSSAVAPRRGRARSAAGTASPQNVVVPPPPDSGTPPSPQAEPQ